MQSSVTDTQYSTTARSTTMYSTGYDTTGMSYTQTGDSVSKTSRTNGYVLVLLNSSDCLLHDDYWATTGIVLLSVSWIYLFPLAMLS